MHNHNTHLSIVRKTVTDSHGRTRAFTLRLPDGSCFDGTRIDDYSLYECAVNDPIGFRLTFGGARDTVNGWFQIVDLVGKKHTKNKDIQNKFEKTHMKKVLRKAYALARIFGRAWIIRIKDSKAETGYNYYGISNLDLASDTQYTWDKNGKFIDIGVRLKFTSAGVIQSIPVTPDNYIFFMYEQGEMDDKGIPVLQAPWNDLISIRSLRDSFRKRIHKYGGFPHITVMGANKTVLTNAQDDWGDFDEMTEAWSNEETEIEMKGLEGVSLNPEVYYSPYIEQVSIATGWPMPILRGQESGQLKSGQINMSSYYAVISNYQDDLDIPAEGLTKWMDESIDNFNITWKLEYATSDIDRLAMREIKSRIAVTLQPYITRKAFAREIDLEIKDLISEEDWKESGKTQSMSGDQSQNQLHQGKEDNIVTKDKGREANEKKEKNLRGKE